MLHSSRGETRRGRPGGRATCKKGGHATAFDGNDDDQEQWLLLRKHAAAIEDNDDLSLHAAALEDDVEW